jgi:hypothetical protein
MSSSGRKTPVKTSTPKHKSNLSESQISLLPDLGKAWVRAGGFFALDPARAHLSNSIPAGLYSYIQLKNEPRTIFLMFTNSYQSLHPKQTAYAGLTTDDLLSGGEIAIGGHGQVAAWAFRTGYLYATLGLANPDLKGPLMQAVGLPVDSFYAVEDWIAFKEGGANHFAAFFTSSGSARTINQPSKLVTNVKVAEENIQQQREARNAYEEIVKQGLTGAAQKLYQVLQTNRDECEVLIQQPIKISDMPRSASSGDVDKHERRASLARLAAEQRLQSQSDRLKVRTLNTLSVDAENLPGTMNEVSLITRTDQNEPTSGGPLSNGYPPKEEGDPPSLVRGEAPIFFEAFEALSRQDSAVEEGRKRIAFDLAMRKPSSRISPTFDVTRLDHRILQDAKEIPEVSSPFSPSENGEKRVAQLMVGSVVAESAGPTAAAFRLFLSRSELGRAKAEKSTVATETVEVIADEYEAVNENPVSCCFSFRGKSGSR